MEPLSFLSVEPNWEPELPRGEDGQCKMANLIRFADPAAVHGGRPH
jgi:hypothetical protein